MKLKNKFFRLLIGAIFYGTIYTLLCSLFSDNWSPDTTVIRGLAGAVGWMIGGGIIYGVGYLWKLHKESQASRR